MHTQALEELFVQELEEMYAAEKQIHKGLGMLAGFAHNSDLKSAFHAHQKETRTQVARIEKAFALLGERRRVGRSPGVAAMIKQARGLARQQDFDPAVIDAGLIAGAQKIEHYELAAYACLRTHAGLLGYKEIEDLLGDSVQEEERANAMLTGIAESAINRDAAAAPYAQARTGPRHGSNGRVEGGHGCRIGLGTIAAGIMVGGALSLLFQSQRPGGR